MGNSKDWGASLIASNEYQRTKKLRIGIDVDGVLAEFDAGFAARAREMYGNPVPGYKPGDWDWTDSGLTKEQIGNVWDVVLNEPRFWYTLPDEPGFSTESLEDLQIAGHELHFITTRYVTNPNVATPFEQTFDWIVERGITYPSVIVTGEKGLIAKALNLDVFVDDKPANLEKVRESRPKCRTYLLDQKHNAWFGNKALYRRVPSFDAFAQMILKGETQI